jgi:hypothetical protein
MPQTGASFRRDRGSVPFRRENSEQLRELGHPQRLFRGRQCARLGTNDKSGVPTGVTMSMSTTVNLYPDTGFKP